MRLRSKVRGLLFSSLISEDSLHSVKKSQEQFWMQLASVTGFTLFEAFDVGFLLPSLLLYCTECQVLFLLALFFPFKQVRSGRSRSALLPSVIVLTFLQGYSFSVAQLCFYSFADILALIGGFRSAAIDKFNDFGSVDHVSSLCEPLVFYILLSERVQQLHNLFTNNIDQQMINIICEIFLFGIVYFLLKVAYLSHLIQYLSLLIDFKMEFSSFLLRKRNRVFKKLSKDRSKQQSRDFKLLNEFIPSTLIFQPEQQFNKDLKSILTNYYFLQLDFVMLEVKYCLQNNYHKVSTDCFMAHPYYYPYFSARDVAPSSLSRLEPEISHLRRSQLTQQLTQIELAVLKKQQELNAERIRQYEDELRGKQSFNDLWEQEKIRVEVNASKWRQQVYQRQLQEIKNQQHLRNLSKLSIQRSRLQKQKAETQRYGEKTSDSQDQRINQRVVLQYQQELLRKLQSNKQNLNKNHKSFDSKQQNSKNHHLKKLQKYQIKITKDREQQFRKKQRGKSISFSNPVIRNQINKSTINEGQQKQYSTLDANRQSKQKKKDGIKKNFNKGYLSCRKNSKNIHTSSRNVKKNSKKIKYFSKNEKNKDISQLKGLGDESLSSRGLKKIENRLRLAAIVFKDAKCKNEKYEIEHLFNTYEGEIRLRKEIKDKINNHPTILRKHNLVITSR